MIRCQIRRALSSGQCARVRTDADIVVGDVQSAQSNDGTGTVYIITGTFGCAYDRVPKDEPLTASYLGGVNGMTVIEIEGDTLKGHFLAIDGKRHDSFQIRKSEP